MDQQPIITEVKGKVARIWLNRPESRNAINLAMMNELLSSLKKINADPDLRIIVLKGSGVSFCAGADLQWMQKAAQISGEDNLKESRWLTRCFYELFASPKITLAGVHGYAFGGAIGLIAACDMAISTENARFAFPEVKLGLVPAAIAPYVHHKTGRPGLLEYLLTGKSFDGRVAAMHGLIDKYVPDEQLDRFLEELIGELLHAAPAAQHSIKKIFQTFGSQIPDRSTIDQTASLLAATRVSEEAVEGIRAFVEKRQPRWINT